MRRGRRFMLLISCGRSSPLLGWTVILSFTFPFIDRLEDHLGGRRRCLPLLLTSSGRFPYQRPLPTYVHLWKMTEWIREWTDKERVNRSTDGQEGLRHHEATCSRRATGVGLGPPQKAWRVSRVTKSFHFLSSNRITQTFLRIFSCSSFISRQTEAKKQEEFKC